jgi:hypothetical protein
MRLDCKDQSVLYREITFCSEINEKHVNDLCGQKVEFLKVKAGWDM